MCESQDDLGRQDPRGCRFIHGHPGDGEWRYCQGPLAEGARLGDAAHPPYCERHAARCLNKATKPFTYYGGWEPNVVLLKPGSGADGPRLPLDLVLRNMSRGMFNND